MKKLGKRNPASLVTIEAYNACTSSCSFPNCDCGVLNIDWNKTSSNKHYASVVAVYSIAGGGGGK